MSEDAGEDRDALAHRMIVGQMMREQWEANPPDPEEWAKALEGCAELYRFAAEHAREHRYQEAARCVASAVRFGSEMHQHLALAYAMSGQAVDDLMANMRESLRRE